MSRPLTRHTSVVSIDGERVEFAVDGATTFGPNRVLLDGDDDLLAGVPGAECGYTIAPFVDRADRTRLRVGLTDLVAEVVGRHRGPVDDQFALAHYHRYVSEPEHQAVLSDLFRDGIPVGDLPIDIRAIEDCVSTVCRVPVSARCPQLDVAVGFVRVVRPASTSDHNPPHRDVWLGHLRNAVNAYIPLAGSTARSSLAVVPGSHRWPEAEIERTVDGARVGAVRYDVPAVIDARHELRMVRPNPSGDELLLFSPYLVHGGSINLEPDQTRVSLELRFWRRS